MSLRKFLTAELYSPAENARLKRFRLTGVPQLQSYEVRYPLGGHIVVPIEVLPIGNDHRSWTLSTMHHDGVNDTPYQIWPPEAYGWAGVIVHGSSSLTLRSEPEP